jgi:hypothetical protein
MTKSTKLLLFGIFLAFVVVAVGYTTLRHEESALSSLVLKCRSEGSSNEEGPWNNYQPAKKQVCDPKVLLDIGLADLNGIQKEIAVAASAKGDVYKNSVFLAIAIFVVLGVPYAWYFLLRRVREISAAIRGG